MKIEDVRLVKNFSRPMGVGSVNDLVESMREHGQLTPIVVSQDNELIAGHRRLEAAKALGWEEIDAVVRECDGPVANLVENLCRQDLTLWQEIKGIRDVFGENPSYAEVARGLSKSRPWVKPRVDVWKLPKEFIDEIRLGKVDLRRLKARLREGRGPSVTQRYFGKPNQLEISDVVTRLMERGREAEARALSFATGSVTKEDILGDES